MSDLLRQRPHPGLILIAAVALGGCANLDTASNQLVNVFTPYRMDIIQGNVISSEQIAALKPGMSRIQVREILGTPLLASVFHADRWDYVFTLRRQGITAQSRKVVVFFKGDALDRFDADTLPSEAEFAASFGTGTGTAPASTVQLQASPESLEKFPAPAKPAAAAPLPPLPASYPPLESAAR